MKTFLSFGTGSLNIPGFQPRIQWIDISISATITLWAAYNVCLALFGNGSLCVHSPNCAGY